MTDGRVPPRWVVLFLLLALGIGGTVVLSLSDSLVSGFVVPVSQNPFESYEQLNAISTLSYLSFL